MMDFMFSVFPVLFTMVFVLVFGTIVYTIFKSIKQEHKNNQSPRLTVEAKVVTKRTSYRKSGGRDNHMSPGYTTYYVTFEVKSGDRMELSVQGHEYGMLVEGDFGELSFQGTRYLGFERRVKPHDL
jgi:hypothetical protein